MVRKFESGATRSPIDGKWCYEGFLSPLVLRRFAEYMHQHRHQSDGQLRSADNWQKGMPLESYMDSGWRHFMDWWTHHRGYSQLPNESQEEALCALLFNVQGYLHEVLREKNAQEGNLSNRVSQKSPNPQDCIDPERKYPF